MDGCYLRVRSSVTQREFGTNPEEPVQASGLDASLGRCYGHVPLGESPGEDQGQAGETASLSWPANKSGASQTPRGTGGSGACFLKLLVPNEQKKTDVHIGLSIPDTSASRQSWKKLATKCQTGTNLRNLASDFFLSQPYSDILDSIQVQSGTNHRY